ncbi:MAG: tRNA pseudouridine(55) synthase TruB [Lachnospiraceae bacterium]|nr:tRNA pseudouridine(55) synthase TruB [Lachnospiraceae bacterium]
MVNGVINVRKERGMTSFDVVSRMRRIFGQKKIGHTGTLDPDAEGVLPVCLGMATRLVESLTKGTKTYEAVLLLGVTTDTQDTSGKILSEQAVSVGEEEAAAAVLSFTGEQEQIPPMYSAIKVNGQKLVDLARRGVEVERKARKVEFSEIIIKEMDLPRIRFSVTCSKGAYIRTLCEDIGKKLGCGGCMESLLRTRVGQFEIGDAYTLDEIRAMKEREDCEAGQDAGAYSFVRPLDMFFTDLPAVTVRESFDKAVYNGNSFRMRGGSSGTEDGLVRIYSSDGTFIGIYKKEGCFMKPEKMFYSPVQQ